MRRSIHKDVAADAAMAAMTMASIDETIPTRRCDKCDAEMTHLSDLQPLSASPPLRIFRCYVCNHVVSEDR
jgi:DNA-directed RNA polymerase subunit M/transcription elongation factor TFIIS